MGKPSRLPLEFHFSLENHGAEGIPSAGMGNPLVRNDGKWDFFPIFLPSSPGLSQVFREIFQLGIPNVFWEETGRDPHGIPTG